MSQGSPGAIGPSERAAVAEGELLQRPPIVGYALGTLGVLTLPEAIEELFRVGGPPALYQTWIHDFVVFSAAVLILTRARYGRSTRVPWLVFGLAMLLWSIGNIGWSIVYGG